MPILAKWRTAHHVHLLRKGTRMLDVPVLHVNLSLCMRGAGYHDGFIIPAGATNILITEVPVNPSVHLGECIYMLK